ncbi:MAG: hypothetical protein ACFFGZ_08095 [Candidatus Thorarchaeota archaeon]
MKTQMAFPVILFFAVSLSCQQSLGCTIFTIAIGDRVLFGNNEDWYIPNTFIWFVPPDVRPGGENHGYAYVGYDENDWTGDGYPQGGINDQGLCFDTNALPISQLDAQPEKEPFPPAFRNWTYFLEFCTTVSDVQNWFLTHGPQTSTNVDGQIHWADSTGDAMVMSVGQDHNWAFTRRENSSFLVSTNVNLANPFNGWPSWRYSRASSLLANITSEENLTVEACRDVLDATHQEGPYPTVYSNIFDLVNRDIYLYSNYTFEKTAKLNLDEELAKGSHRYKIADLFIEETSSASSSSSSGLEFLITPIAVIFLGIRLRWQKNRLQKKK